MKLRFIMILFFVVGIFVSAYADEIILNDGERVSGTITKETFFKVIIENPSKETMTIKKGDIRCRINKKRQKLAVIKEIEKIQRSYHVKAEKNKKEIVEKKKEQKIVSNIKKVEKHLAVAKEVNKWQRKISLGGGLTGGNSESSQLSVDLKVDKKTKGDEWNFRVSNYLSSSNRKMNSRKHSGLARYARSFGEGLKWYNFYKFEASQDYFANIDYRLGPSLGFGYWFFDKNDFRLMVEGAVGFQHTNYRSSADDKNEAVIVPRCFIKKKLFGNMIVSHDAAYYPSLGDLGEFRTHNETEVVNPINDDLSLKMSLIRDYNTDPSDDVEKLDYTLLSSLDYSF